MTLSQWDAIRDQKSDEIAQEVLWATIPDGVGISSIDHLRTAHYAVYRVYDTSGDSWVARVGVVSPEDDAPADNGGYLGTSTLSPTGQMREYQIASAFAAVNANVCVPKHYARAADGFDVLWMPFIESVDTPLNASQWHHALAGLHAYSPSEELPVFTNRSKTFARLDEIGGPVAQEIRQRYDNELAGLFSTATRWSVVHGDAHSGNALNDGDKAVIFDFDTACWAPSVWDLTHLLNRAGTDGNTGYTARELRSLFKFTDAEVDTALALRRTAALTAKYHREHRCRANQSLITTGQAAP